MTNAAWVQLLKFLLDERLHLLSAVVDEEHLEAAREDLRFILSYPEQVIATALNEEWELWVEEGQPRPAAGSEVTLTQVILISRQVLVDSFHRAKGRH